MSAPQDIPAYRPGATGALLDEYERAVATLKEVIGTLPDQALPVITDPCMADENCRSVQAILSHVVHAGFGYAVSIRNLKESAIERPGKVFHHTVGAYLSDLDAVVAFTVNVLSSFTDEELEQQNESLKIKAGWGQTYDAEQMMEHAIVHVLRHRRQIERIKAGKLLIPAAGEP